MRRTAGLAVALLASAVLPAWGAELVEPPGEDAHDAANVTLLDGDGITLATVDARVAGGPTGADGRITAIHVADVPGSGADPARYEGRARWVLEVPRGFVASRGVETGDYVRIRYAGTAG